MKFELNSLEATFKTLDIFCHDNKIGGSTCNNLRVICEELIVNMFKYSKADIFTLELKEVDDCIKINLAYKAKMFDVTKQTNLKTEQSISQRKFGGVGLTLVHALTCKFNYLYKEGTNVITATLKTK